MSSLVTLDDIREAQVRCATLTVRTGLIRCHVHELDSANDTRELYLKPENLQPIGAFKLRGAYNKIASLNPEDRIGA